MVAALNNPPVLNHQNSIGVAHSGKTMRNDKNRSPLHQAVHTLFNQRLSARINRTGGFIQHQNRRISHSRPGNRQKLALSLR